MNRITKDDVEHIGWLARIDISENDKDLFAGQLNSILEYFQLLDEIDTENVEPTHHVLDIYNVFREDASGKGIDQDDALGNAPKKEDDYFKSPRII